MSKTTGRAPLLLSLAASVVALSFAGACNRAGGGGASVTPKTEEEKTVYALGLDIGHNIKFFNLSPAERALMIQGITDHLTGQPDKADYQTYRPKLSQLARDRQQSGVKVEKDKGKAALEKAAKEPSAQRLDSGIVIKQLKAGTGASPSADDTVKVNYEGRLTDGTVFDSSAKHGQPAEFPLRGVIRCWTEGVQKMVVGEKAQLTCPSDLAYGDNGSPPTIPGGATLVFDVELLDIVKKAAPPAMTPPPATPPPAAAAAAAAKPKAAPAAKPATP